jgi:hypothetical protein
MLVDVLDSWMKRASLFKQPCGRRGPGRADAGEIETLQGDKGRLAG